MLTIPKLEPILFTMKEVAESEQLRVTIEKNSDLSTQFLVDLLFILKVFQSQ